MGIPKSSILAYARTENTHVPSFRLQNLDFSPIPKSTVIRTQALKEGFAYSTIRLEDHILRCA